MKLGTVDLINGILSIIFVSISIMVGLKIISKYIKYKQRNLLFVGITWIGLVSIWYASSISTILILITGSGISDEFYMFIGNGLLPITSFIWMMAFTNLMFKDKQRIILVIFGIYNLIFESVFIYFLFTNIEFLGRVTGPVDASYGFFVSVYQLSLLIMIIITGTLFARESLISKIPEVKLKGKFLLFAFYSLVLGSIMEIFSHYSLIILIIARLILILSSLACYSGFILPKIIKKLFIKT